MIDVKKPVRKAYYELLNGALSYNATNVPVSDDAKKLADTASLYVILSNQSGVDAGTMHSFDSSEDIVIDIVHKGSSRVNKEVVDNVASQILNLVLPLPSTDGLPLQMGVQINCVRLSDDRYITLALNNSNSVVRRLLTFKQRVRQTLDNTPVIGLKGIIAISGADFATATQYVNASLNGKSYEIFFNDASVFIKHDTEWQYLPGGGFEIFLPGFDATENNYDIYILLK